MTVTSPAAEIPAASATLLDYFAARAPRDIPRWFMPGADKVDGALYATEELIAAAQFEIDAQYQVERFYQWPWVYADIMLMNRELYLTQDNKIVPEEVAPRPLDEAEQEVVRKGLVAAVNAAKVLYPDLDADHQPGSDLLAALMRFAIDCRSPAAANDET